MDESGCLGFDFNKSRTSKYFLITFLFCNNKRPLEKIVRKVFQAMSQKHRNSHSGTLHCHKEGLNIRLKIFNELCVKE